MGKMELINIIAKTAIQLQSDGNVIKNIKINNNIKTKQLNKKTAPTKNLAVFKLLYYP